MRWQETGQMELARFLWKRDIYDAPAGRKSNEENIDGARSRYTVKGVYYVYRNQMSFSVVSEYGWQVWFASW